MSKFHFAPPSGWAQTEAEEHGTVLERVVSDKGQANPRILIRIVPMPASADEIPGIAPSELRAQGFDQVEVVQQDWHSPETAYPYLNQMVRAQRPFAEGASEKIGVGSVHIVMSDDDDPSRKELLSFELRFHPDDEVDRLIQEFGELVASTSVLER